MELGHLLRRGDTPGDFHPEAEGVVSPLAQGFNPGTGHPKRRALKGRQIECPNKAELGVNGLIVAL